MTAEIALLNRTALALAADSAVTIRIGQQQKVYDSAEKIFELSRGQPIALMIYNNVDHVGVPLDVLIRKYRAENSEEFKVVPDAAGAFLDYLGAFPHRNEDEDHYLFGVLWEAFDSIHLRLVTALRKEIASGKKRISKSSIKQKLDALISEEMLREEGMPLAGYLPGITLPDFEARYGSVCDDVAKEIIKITTVDAALLGQLRRLAFAIVKSQAQTGSRTGLVFGGFGKNDMFPTLYYVEIDGVYFGELKILSRVEVDIDRNGERAQMVPFAQKEMADRFIYGLDEELSGQISELFTQAVDEILKTTMKRSAKSTKTFIKKVVLDQFNQTLGALRDTNRKNILDIVNFMSKKELAEMAHALVELTSKKRRFSTELETVGGPIDVAIVTKNEGFIWIRRKHYFDRDVNPGYYARVFEK